MLVMSGFILVCGLWWAQASRGEGLGHLGTWTTQVQPLCRSAIEKLAFENGQQGRKVVLPL